MHLPVVDRVSAARRQHPKGSEVLSKRGIGTERGDRLQCVLLVQLCLVYFLDGMPPTSPSSHSPRKAHLGQDFSRRLASGKTCRTVSAQPAPCPADLLSFQIATAHFVTLPNEVTEILFFLESWAVRAFMGRA